MLSALAMVLLNPGAHPPFYLWIAGPLVLYAAVAGDGVVSLAGLALSWAGTLTQFCQEGSDEYFILNFGAVPREHGLQCVAPAPVLAAVALCSALLIVVASYRRELFAGWLAQACGRTARVAAALSFVLFAGTIAVETASAASLRSARGAYVEEQSAVSTFAVAPSVRHEGGQCSLTYSAEDVVVFAANAYAARFATAALGYTLYSPGDRSHSRSHAAGRTRCRRITRMSICAQSISIRRASRASSIFRHRFGRIVRWRRSSSVPARSSRKIRC